MDKIPFVERKFDLNGGVLAVRFHAPIKMPDGEFRCCWSIAWPEQEVCRYACGEDGVQALLLAMRVAHSELVESDAYKAGHLTLWGQTDLGLPPTWGTEPLHDVSSPNGGASPGAA